MYIFVISAVMKIGMLRMFLFNFTAELFNSQKLK